MQRPDRTPLDLLRVARVLAGLSHRELAGRIGVSVWRYGRIEAGVSPMRSAEHAALLRELPLLEQLLGDQIEIDGAVEARGTTTVVVPTAAESGRTGADDA